MTFPMPYVVPFGHPTEFMLTLGRSIPMGWNYDDPYADISPSADKFRLGGFPVRRVYVRRVQNGPSRDAFGAVVVAQEEPDFRIRIGSWVYDTSNVSISSANPSGTYTVEWGMVSVGQTPWLTGSTEVGKMFLLEILR